jgi:hypothetical protein
MSRRIGVPLQHIEKEFTIRKKLLDLVAEDKRLMTYKEFSQVINNYYKDPKMVLEHYNIDPDKVEQVISAKRIIIQYESEEDKESDETKAQKTVVADKKKIVDDAKVKSYYDKYSQDEGSMAAKPQNKDDKPQIATKPEVQIEPAITEKPKIEIQGAAKSSLGLAGIVPSTDIKSKKPVKSKKVRLVHKTIKKIKKSVSKKINIHLKASKKSSKTSRDSSGPKKPKKRSIKG